MYHEPITGKTGGGMMEFSHFRADAQPGQWRRENIILRENIKINIFVEGEFSVFADGRIHNPVYGDVCLLAPRKMHYGQITKYTRLEYYQLDVGVKALEGIPEGDVLIGNILTVAAAGNAFLRPAEREQKQLMQQCDRIEQDLRNGNRTMAFVRAVEFLSVLYQVFVSGGKAAAFSLSFHSAGVLRSIDAHFAEQLSITALAEQQGVSASYLCRVFKEEVGIGIHQYLNQYRVLKAASLLDTHSVAEVCYLCGFCDSSHFISVFKKHMQCTPMQYKKRHDTGLPGQ